jgi:hypothetical protein
MNAPYFTNDHQSGITKTNNADPQGARPVGAPYETFWNTLEDTKVKK